MPDIPVTWLDRRTVNNTTAGNQSDPDIIQLANGNIIVSWTSDNDTGAGSNSGLDVIGQIFVPLGNKLADGEFRLNNAFFADDEQDMDMAPLPGGGFISVFEDTDANGTSIRLNEYNASGVHVTDNSTCWPTDLWPTRTIATRSSRCRVLLRRSSSMKFQARARPESTEISITRSPTPMGRHWKCWSTPACPMRTSPC